MPSLHLQQQHRQSCCCGPMEHRRSTHCFIINLIKFTELKFYLLSCGRVVLQASRYIGREFSEWQRSVKCNENNQQFINIGGKNVFLQMSVSVRETRWIIEVTCARTRSSDKATQQWMWLDCKKAGSVETRSGLLCWMMWRTRLCLKPMSAPDGLGRQLGHSPVFPVSLTLARPLWLSLTTRLISRNYGNREAERIFVTRRLRTQIKLKMGNVSFQMRWLATRRNYMQDVTSAKNNVNCCLLACFFFVFLPHLLSCC